MWFVMVQIQYEYSAERACALLRPTRCTLICNGADTASSRPRFVRYARPRAVVSHARGGMHESTMHVESPCMFSRSDFKQVRVRNPEMFFSELLV